MFREIERSCNIDINSNSRMHMPTTAIDRQPGYVMHTLPDELFPAMYRSYPLPPHRPGYGLCKGKAERGWRECS